MMNAWCMLSVAGCVLLAGVRENSGAQQSITPDQELQTAIERFAAPTQSRAEMYAQLEELKRLALKSPEHFFEQLLYYCSNEQDERRGLRAFLLAGGLRLPNTVIADVASRYAYAEDEDLSAEARGFLRIAEEGWRREPGKYYESVIRARKDDPPLGLIRFMFGTSPERAIGVMLRVEEDDKPDLRAVRWGEHVVSDYLWKWRHRFHEAADESLASAMKELDAMSRHGTWWVRLYVAEILRQYAQFRTAELIERLKADEHELVRRAILDIDKSKSQK